MKKNLLFTALAATTLLFATSCQQDEVFVDGNETVVTFEVGTPEIATRAYSDGLTATKLQWAVYHDNNGVDNDTPVMRDGKHLTGEATLEDGKASVNIQLAAGKGYNVLFWADAYGKDEQNKPYDVNLAEKKLTITDYSTVKSNDESRDAFYCYRPITVGTANTTETIILTRPFAQLNIGTNDLAIALADGIDVSKTGVKVSEVYNTLNFVDGTVSGLVEDQVFTLSTRPEAYSAENTDGEKFPVDGYDYLAMNYILVGANKTVVDIDFSYGDATARTRTYTGIPVQANYRTNIYGALLTQGIDFDVEIVPGYNGNIPGDDMLDQLIIASQVGGEITLSEDITTDGVITVAENVELTINLNGKTITGAMPRSVGGVIKNNGTLTIKGGTISSTATDGGSAVYSTGNLTLENVTLNGAPYGTGTTYPSYALNIYGKNTHLKNVTINGTHGALAAVSNGTTIVEDCNLTVSGRNNSDHVFYLNHADAKVTVKGGTYTNNDTGYSYVAYVGAGELTLEDGTFSAPNVASTKGMATGTEGKIFVKGGTFGFDPSEYVAPGYVAMQSGSTYMVKAIDAASRTITINSAEEFLYLNTLNEKWVEFFTNGLGTDYSNYATVNGGKGVDYYYKWGWTIKLNADIDLKNITLDTPININTWGYFDGQNHTIKNVTIETGNTTENAAGLFTANTCAIKNVKLDNVHVTGSLVGNSTAAILAADCNAADGVDNITITNSSVWGGKYTGGVVGYGYTSVTNCTLTDCVVKGGYKLGGIIGYICTSNGATKAADGHTLTDCTVNGTDGQYAGGKVKYVIGRIVGNFNCDGTCQNNIVTNMTTVATSDIGAIENGMNVTGYNMYVTPENYATLTIKSNTQYYLEGNFNSKNVSLVMPIGVENVVFDGTNATNINELIITQNGQLINNANTPIGNRSGKVTVQNFNVLSQINVFACKTEVVVQKNTAEALMVYAGNCDVKVLNNTIDANFESHPTYQNATTTWNTNNYGIALNIFDYNLWLDGNTVTDASGHAIGINGWETTIDNGDENVIESFKNNTITVNSTTSTKRAAFKVWDDETYASNDEDTNAINATAQAFISAVLADGSNTFNILDGYNHTIFCFYNVNTNN
ncbi:MAG: hypothetical protein E7084_00045 [Bacteroidales bacterium]|nr:hypothetical protein [Bacteroidales bacterium]